MTPPLLTRGVLAATNNPLPLAYSVPNGPESHSADVDYDMLLPMETVVNEPYCSHSKVPHVQRERSSACNGFAASGGRAVATSRSAETLTTLHRDPRPPKLSTSRKNQTQPTPGKQQNNGSGVRSPSGHSSSIPMKRINSRSGKD
jgi:hypothetical protein